MKNDMTLSAVTRFVAIVNNLPQNEQEDLRKWANSAVGDAKENESLAHHVARALFPTVSYNATPLAV